MAVVKLLLQVGRLAKLLTWVAIPASGMLGLRLCTAFTLQVMLYLQDCCLLSGKTMALIQIYQLTFEPLSDVTAPG